MEKDKVFAAKVAEEEEVALVGFMTVHKEVSTAKVAPVSKHMFPGMQEAGSSVKQCHVKQGEALSSDSTQPSHKAQQLVYMEFQKQVELQKEMAEQEDRVVTERQWQAEFKLHQDDLVLCHAELELAWLNSTCQDKQDAQVAYKENDARQLKK